MTDTTTVRVRASTRDTLNAEVALADSTADAVIAAGMRALRRERLRRQFERDARLAAQNPDDRAEVADAIWGLVGGDD